MKTFHLFKTIAAVLVSLPILLFSVSTAFAHWFGYPYGSAMGFLDYYYPGYGLLFFSFF